MKITHYLLVLTSLCTLGPAAERGEIVLADPGFENYAVSSGGFLKPTSGSWTFNNDAGVVEPYSPNSSTGPLNTWSATFAPFEGQQYACTYAGADSIWQPVTISSAGVYRISVYAAAPDGNLTIPSVGTWPLLDGVFAFTVAGHAIGNVHSVPRGSNWTLYQADFSIEKPGGYLLGVRNQLVAPYFINYDAFAVQQVPEPGTLSLLLVLGIVAGIEAMRRRTKIAPPRL
jgi:hypothetical protein